MVFVMTGTDQPGKGTHVLGGFPIANPEPIVTPDFKKMIWEVVFYPVLRETYAHQTLDVAINISVISTMMQIIIMGFVLR